MVFEGRIEKGMVVVDGPVPLPDGTRVRKMRLGQNDFIYRSSPFAPP